MTNGFMCILLNESFPKRVKISGIENRYEDISKKDFGIPNLQTPFVIAYKEFVLDYEDVENYLFKQFTKNYKLLSNGFFQISFNLAVKFLQDEIKVFRNATLPASNVINVLPWLKQEFEPFLVENIVSVEFVQYSEACYIEASYKYYLHSSFNLVEKIILTNKNNHKNFAFSSTNTVEENISSLYKRGYCILPVITSLFTREGLRALLQ